MTDEPHGNSPPTSPLLSVAYALRMVSGPTVGKSWVLSEPVTAIGRGLGCCIRIEDPRVSRVQCELTMEGNSLRLRCVGQRNPTYVNDVIQEDVILSHGDLISFAEIALILDCAPASANEAAVSAEDMRTTQTFADAIHLRGEFDAAAYSQDPRLAGDLHSLLQLVRLLGRAESLDTLARNLTAHLRERFKTEHVWIAWRRDLHEDLVLYPPASPEETRKAPIRIMRDASARGEGVMDPGLGIQSDVSMLAAPLVHGRDSFGSIAVRRSGKAAPFLDPDLQYLVAVAECCAPLVRGAERLDQIRRDSQSNDASPPLLSAGMSGDSPTLRALRAELRQAALSRVNVLLQGETGVGKELTARMLHDFSTRGSGPYVAVNCAAIPAELFESEMFGHEHGAFTGASRRRKGLFELAHGGTLFLDEIGDLSMVNQARLLRAVDTGVFRPVGSEKELAVDVRIVCATNRILPDKNQMFFRSDLYHRLAGVVVHIKPLRERKEDIRGLADHFLRLASSHMPTHPREFTQEAYDKLMAYDWPGNIRELRNVVERLCFTTQAERITSIDIRIDSITPFTVPMNADSFDNLERQYILNVMQRHDNNVMQAAQFLGISRSALYYKLARHSIKPRALRK